MTIQSLEELFSKRNGRATAERIRWIDGALRWEGGFNRRDAAERFGIHETQVSNDINRYLDLGGHVRFDHKTKVIRPTKDFRPLTDIGLAEWLCMRSSVPLSAFAKTEPELDEEAVRALLEAQRREIPCAVAYYSAARADLRRTILCPHAFFTDDWLPWARGWDFEQGGFVEICLPHVVEARTDTSLPPRAGARRGGGARWIGGDADVAWTAVVRVTLKVNPALPPGRRFLVEREHGMRDGVVTTTVRRALIWRLLRTHGLLESVRDGLPPPDACAVVVEDPSTLAEWVRRDAVG